MLKRLFVNTKESQQKYAALIEAAQAHDYQKLHDAVGQGLNLEYIVPSVGKSALQVLAEDPLPGDEDAILSLNNKKIFASYQKYRANKNSLAIREANEALFMKALQLKLAVPIDADGYIISYEPDDHKGIKQFFDHYGFVVVRDVLNKQECQATIDEIWETHSGMSGGMVKRDDARTWEKHWPGLVGEGISGGNCVVKPQFVRNRSNAKVHHVASVLLSDKKLITNIDRFGIFRPTKKHPEWKTTRNIHLDMNPVYWYESPDAHEDDDLVNSLTYDSPLHFILENNVVGSRASAYGKKVHIQGLINLEDNRDEDGGFLVCPHVHARLAEVTKQKLELWRNQFGDKNKFCVLPEDGNEDIHRLATRVTARAGSLVFWSQLSPHGSAPNNSSNFRYAQFIKMFPASSLSPARAKLRSTAVKKMLENADVKELSDLGKRTHGLTKW
jgi:ectoine hydroxylase-related dioxygenase (phytanoyl-CoA dioxygenase family)